MPAPADCLWNKNEVAERVGLHRNTLMKLVRTGSFPQPRSAPGVRKTLWRASDVMAWIADLPPAAASPEPAQLTRKPRRAPPPK